jgi:signal transduction histidine kinase
MLTRFAPLAALHNLHHFDVIGLVTQLVVTGVIALSYTTGDPRRWWALGVLAVFIAAQYYLAANHSALAKDHPQALHLYFLGFTLLVLLLMFLDINSNGIVVLLFILSGEVLSFFPDRRGYLWVALWGAIITGAMLIWFDDSLRGLLIGLGITCGMVFMGSAAMAQRRAEEASAESRRLLAELQAAHSQLRASAARAEELAAAHERNRLAREMHDTLGHRLTVAAVQLEGAQRLIPRNSEKAAQMVETVRQQVLDGLQELRQTVATLRAPLEADLALATALGRLVQQFQMATTLTVNLDLPAQLPALSPEQRHAIYRTVQEGLTNVQRHAQASQVAVRLTLTNGHSAPPCLQVSIEDNGRGSTADPAALGFGLHGIRERAEQLAGQMTIVPGPQGGTRLVVALPVESVDGG